MQPSKFELAVGASVLTVLGFKALGRYHAAVESHAREERLARCLHRGGAPFRVAICGAGMSGVAMAVRLSQAGVPFTMFEMMDEFGGTWLKNTYPDAACDVPVQWYAYSFAQKADWTRMWAQQPEILDYIRGVADEHVLRPRCKFNARVDSAEVDPSRGADCWEVRYTDLKSQTQHIERFTCFVTAVGQLDQPSVPRFEGAERFQGKAFHTAEWDHAEPLEGRNVVGIGTGPSAVQAFPAVARQGVARLTVVQRSPPWVLAKNDYVFSRFARRLFRWFPVVVQLRRLYAMLANEVLLYMLVIRNGHKPKLQAFIKRRLRAEMREQLGPAGQHLRDQVTPTYPLACKRLALSDDWLPMLARGNVVLQTSAVKAVHERSVEFQDGSTAPCDVLIYATGFKSTRFLGTVDVRRKAGVSLEQEWQGVPHAFRGIAVAGFPNMYLLYGPGTNLAHSSIIFMVERQVEYIVELFKHQIASNVDQLEVTREAYEADFRQLQRDLRNKTFASPECTNWYRVGGSGPVVNNWSGSILTYWWKMRHLDLGSYTQRSGAAAAAARL